MLHALPPSYFRPIDIRYDLYFCERPGATRWDTAFASSSADSTATSSLLTPPFGVALFYLRGVAPPEIKTTDIYRGVLPFIGIQVVGLVLIILFPELATGLLD